MIHLFRNKKSTSGFTLIELLVVIAIIGVLATVVLASLNTARRKSRDARRVTDVKQIQLALELYFDGAGNDNYPEGNTTCDATQEYGLRVLQTSGYIASVPHDPSNIGVCYRYTPQTVLAVRSSYHLAIILEDSTNNAFNSDRDCNDNVTGSCGVEAAATWAITPGVRTQGVMSTDCVLAAGPVDNCYDVTP